MKWCPGDVALIKSHVGGCLIAGTEVMLVKFWGTKPGRDARTGEWLLVDMAWEVELYPGNTAYCSEILLTPLPPPEQVSTWDEAIFKPKILERIV